MKNILSTLVLVTAFLAFSFNSNAQTTNYTVPVNSSIYSTCAGEIIDMVGNIHIVYKSSAVGKKNTLFIYHTNYSGVTGIGRISGDTYTVNGASNSKISVINGTNNYSFNTSTNIIGKGKVINQVFHFKNDVNFDWSTTPPTITSKNYKYSITCH